MNINKSAIYILLILVSTVILSGCGYNIRISSGNGHNILKEEDAKDFSVKKAVTQPIESIEINTRIADIEIIKSDDYYVEIDYLYWDKEPVYTLEDGKLTFNDEESIPESYTISFNLQNVIRIYLPEDAPLDRVSVYSSCGNADLSGFIAKSLKANVSYGNFTMKDCAADKTTVKLSSGKSSISDFQTGDLDFNNAYGNSYFSSINVGESKLPDDISFDKIDISMSSGNADIDNVYTESFEIDNSYGSIDCVSITADSFDAKLSSGNLKIVNGDFKQADLSNSYGNITSELLGNEEDYSMDLETSYGNIKVNGKSYDDHLIIDNGEVRSITANLSSGDVRITFQDK
jgi:hypothetical protein